MNNKCQIFILNLDLNFKIKSFFLKYEHYNFNKKVQYTM